jgi:hypothetical protein
MGTGDCESVCIQSCFGFRNSVIMDIYLFDVTYFKTTEDARNSPCGYSKAVSVQFELPVSSQLCEFGLVCFAIGFELEKL